MRLSALPPVRRAVPLRRGSADTRIIMEQFFGDRRIFLYSSGTAALAQAMRCCVSRRPVEAPEAIIPAYGCPDLVAACIAAAVYPRLVDLTPSRWSYDPNALQSSLSSNTVALVAVNLLGVGDGSAELIQLCRDRGIPLIQDSAQHLPREVGEWPGDYVVLSFGRGKPLNLLRGGALVAPPESANTTADTGVVQSRRSRLLGSRAAAIAFNALSRPCVYRIITALPGTRLGEVTYRSLDNPGQLPEQIWRQVGTAFKLYRRKPSYRRDIWEPALQEWASMGILPLDSPGSLPPTEPLRLALLAPNRAARDLLVAGLDRHGLGATRFYGAELPQIAGVPEAVRGQGPFPNARLLADRLFTLPTHALVTGEDVRLAREVALAWHRSIRHSQVPDCP